MDKTIVHTEQFHLKKTLRNSLNIIRNLICFAWYYSICRNYKIYEKVKSVEFICFGNICRSIFAEKYALALYNKQASPVHYSSSGLSAKEGTSSPAEAIKAASLFNADLTRHYSKKTTDQSLKGADLVFCMHFRQFRQLWKKYPLYRKKIFLLKALDGKFHFNLNIDDPYGKSTEIYEKCFSEIAEKVALLSKQIDKNVYAGTKPSMKDICELKL